MYISFFRFPKAVAALCPCRSLSLSMSLFCELHRHILHHAQQRTRIHGLLFLFLFLKLNVLKNSLPRATAQVPSSPPYAWCCKECTICSFFQYRLVGCPISRCFPVRRSRESKLAVTFCLCVSCIRTVTTPLLPLNGRTRTLPFFFCFVFVQGCGTILPFVLSLLLVLLNAVSWVCVYIIRWTARISVVVLPSLPHPPPLLLLCFHACARVCASLLYFLFCLLSLFELQPTLLFYCFSFQ